MYAVAGVTGNTGAIVAHTLLDQGERVRVIVRSRDKAAPFAARGAEVAVADLDDADALARALAGARGAYLLSPPDPRAEDFLALRARTAEALARAVAASDVGHVVFLSSMGADRPGGTGPIVTLHRAEARLAATGRPVTFVRPSYFLENWAPVLPAARADGVLPSFLAADVPVATVSVRDVGRVAARALREGPRGRRVIELAGPADVTAADVARAAGEVLGRPVTLQVAPLEALVPTFTSFGFSRQMAALYEELTAALNAGRIRWEGEPLRGEVGLREGLAPLLAG